MMKPKLKSDEKAVREIIEDWAAATRENRNDDVLNGHDRSALIFDVLAPLQYKGAAAYRKSWADWQPTFEVPSLFELKELRVVVGSDVAFCHCLIRCGGKLPSGEVVEDLVRATFCLQKKSVTWKIAHQHISMPVTK
jgi:ketosteroid isomerase-like protein